MKLKKMTGMKEWSKTIMIYYYAL